MQCLSERTTPPADAARVGDVVGLLAARALFAELACFPKPGLVSFRDPGSNRDMDAALFSRSIVALRPFFAALACAGCRGESFESLRRIGVGAEQAMLRATGGVNTHRGAIFSLGLLAAGAGRLVATGEWPAAPALSGIVPDAWGKGIAAHELPSRSHGARARERFGVRGARGEAARGFPVLFNAGCPALEEALVRGCDFTRAMTQAFFAILAALDDTNLLHRAGREGLVFAQGGARRFLEGGGVFEPGWRARAGDLHWRFVERGLNPGGAGDMLACAAFVHFVAEKAAASFNKKCSTTEDAEITEFHGGSVAQGRGGFPYPVEEGRWASR